MKSFSFEQNKNPSEKRVQTENLLREIIASGEKLVFKEGEKNKIDFSPISKTHFGTLNAEGVEILERVQAESKSDKKRKSRKKRHNSSLKRSATSETLSVFRQGLPDLGCTKIVKVKKCKINVRLQDRKYIP